MPMSGFEISFIHLKKSIRQQPQQQQQQQPLFTLFWKRKKKGGKETKYRKQNNGRFIVIYIYVWIFENGVEKFN